MLIDFKDEDFETKIKNEEVSVIQYSAAWCGPCKSLKPIMDKFSETYKDKNVSCIMQMLRKMVLIPPRWPV